MIYSLFFLKPEPLTLTHAGYYSIAQIVVLNSAGILKDYQCFYSMKKPRLGETIPV